MKRLTVLVCVVLAGAGWADSQEVPQPAGAAAAVPAQRELAELLEASTPWPVGELTVGEIVAFRGLISIARQQQEYVKSAAAFSYLVPGMGHYAIGERGTGLLILTADIAIRSAAAVSAYMLLPAALRAANLNYLQTPIADIQQRWKAQTLSDYLMPAGIMMTGSVLSLFIRAFAARTAKEAALSRITNGQVVFEPAPVP